jgi:hypothetical protein
MEFDHRAAMLRSRGKTYKQIGEMLGIPLQTAYSMVKRAIDDIPTEATVELIALELAKLDNHEQKYYGIMEKLHQHVTLKGDIVEFDDDALVMKALEGLLKISDRRAKLLGLNAPVRTELAGVMVNVNVDDHSEQAKQAVLGLLTRLKDE